MDRRELEAFLALLADRLVARLVSGPGGIREGAVMSLAGVAPYRRLDCDGKALCYLRCRPMKRVVRIDVSGLWRCPGPSQLALNRSAGSLTLMVTNLEDVEEAASYLRAVVAATRQLAA